MSDIDLIRDRATRLLKLARKARDNHLDDYAAQLEELAAEASAHAARLTSETQQQQQPQSSDPEKET